MVAPHWKNPVEAKPFGLAEPLSEAASPQTPVAASVVPLGLTLEPPNAGDCQMIPPSATVMKVLLKNTAAFRSVCATVGKGLQLAPSIETRGIPPPLCFRSTPAARNSPLP